jgi:malonate-semialdehyde dehydrogenase (acetylating) / methylmalonate-semialdehyde dehydrogenase
MIQDGQLLNYIGGTWKRSRASEYLDVRNPATAETMVRVPLSPRDEVDEAARLAQAAFADWRRTPPVDRIQYLFKFKQLLEDHFDEIASLTTQECGKTLAEAGGELRRGIENVEVAMGIPSLMQGYNSEDIASGIMAFFPFSGWKESFFGDMHAQGRDAVEFYTQQKVVVERWPREWSRTF